MLCALISDAIFKQPKTVQLPGRHCEPTGLRKAPPDDGLSDIRE
jgi:hypothetical protein